MKGKSGNLTGVIYCRSSKDRGAGVSIDSQREALYALAEEQGVAIVDEYVDVAESGACEVRPEFMRLYHDLGNCYRGWDVVYFYDTSRLGREEYLPVIFERDAEKNGVKVVYRSVPESDPITQTIVKGVSRVFDKVHRETCKQKGLAGMRQNILKGFRSGGSLPRGYSAEKIDTGVIREGKRVYKTKLVPNDEAPIVTKYLELRAMGYSRRLASEESGLKASSSSLNILERKAKTIYSGHTAWNQHNERLPDGKYKCGKRFRPENEWVICENTHKALITKDVADKIQGMLDENSRKLRKCSHKYLLSGLLQTPDGLYWQGNFDKRCNSKCYRVKFPKGGSKQIKCDRIDNVVLEQVLSDVQSPRFVDGMIESLSNKNEDVLKKKNLQKDINALKQKIKSTIDLAAEVKKADRLLILERISDFNQELVKKQEQFDQINYFDVHQVKLNQVKFLLKNIFIDLQQKRKDVEIINNILRGLIGSVVLDPYSLECQVCYELAIKNSTGFDHRNKKSLPRGLEPLFLP